MSQFIEDFFSSFQWYRELSHRLLEELSPEVLQMQINERSLPVIEQFIDLGDMQLKMSEFISGVKPILAVERPNPMNTTKEQVKIYLLECEQVFKDTLSKVENEDSISVSWFDRMKFNFKQALHFVLAHEAMHHGEILSFIFAKQVPMPPAFKQTWGFERNK
jgi:uncharacterized damage-inducible protein DinB